MTQLALVNRVPTISYCTADLPLSSIDDLCHASKDPTLQFRDLEPFHREICRLIQSEESRSQFREKLGKLVVEAEEFASGLNNLLSTPRSEEVIPLEFENGPIEDLYLELENHWLRQYDLVKWRSLGAKYMRYDLCGSILSLVLIFLLQGDRVKGHLRRRLLPLWT
jgi:hypothetical protein